MTRPDDAESARLRKELAAEFGHHMEMIERSEIACGVCPDAARERAIQRFGDQERAARECERIVMGAPYMGKALQVARIVGVSAWRIGVVAALAVCVMHASSANQRATEAANLAAATAQRLGLNVVSAGTFSHGERAALLKSIWGPASGEIEVRGAVKSPGKFYTETNAPLDLASLIERAGGATEGAKQIIWNQRGEPGDLYTTIVNAERFRGDLNSMPAPGSIITIK